MFPSAFAIYGHGNVACIGQAMEENKKNFSGNRGHHEQYMALTWIDYSIAMRRKQIKNAIKLIKKSNKPIIKE
mgnify:CR=1 FL=1